MDREEANELVRRVLRIHEVYRDRTNRLIGKAYTVLMLLSFAFATFYVLRLLAMLLMQGLAVPFPIHWLA